VTDLEKAFIWLFGRDTGMSSKAIMGHMVSGVSDGSWPSDPGDLGRCLRLLEGFPSWNERIGEMAKYGPVWEIYARHWDELRSMMDAEVGADWSKGRKAQSTYDFMKKLQSQAKEPA
jgi:hypothetical protein